MPLTFLSLPPDRCQPAAAKYRVIPVPYEGTVCFGKGTSKGPQAVLEVSDQIEHFDEELLCDFTRQGIATFPPIPSAATPAEEYARIYQTVKRETYFEKGKIPLFIGGEHSITPPLVRAAAEYYNAKYGNVEYDHVEYGSAEYGHADNSNTENNNTDGGAISVLQFDAHADLRDSFTGGKFSHASAMRRVLEITPNIVQVGIRSFSEEEYQECPVQIKNIITPHRWAEDKIGCLAAIEQSLTQYVYITVDIDVFDPAFAPGTGTPEPGGLDWFQVTEVLRRVCKTKTLIGADVVEVAPQSNSTVTEFLAARLLGKIIAYTS